MDLIHDDVTDTQNSTLDSIWDPLDDFDQLFTHNQDFPLDTFDTETDSIMWNPLYPLIAYHPDFITMEVDTAPTGLPNYPQPDYKALRDWLINYTPKLAQKDNDNGIKLNLTKVEDNTDMVKHNTETDTVDTSTDIQLEEETVERKAKKGIFTRTRHWLRKKFRRSKP